MPGFDMNTLKYFSMALVCSVFLNVGCTSVQPERKYPVPEFFLQFEAGDGSFNNRYALTERLNNALLAYDKRPVVVMVASANTAEDYQLAIARLFSVTNEVAVDADFRVLVKPLERLEHKDSVAIYHAPSWSIFHKHYMADSDFTFIDNSGGVYRSSDARLYLLKPLQRTITPDGNTALEQLQSVLSQVGWELTVALPDSYQTTNVLQSLKVVTLEEDASSHEVTYLLKSILPDLLPGCDFTVDPVGNRVNIWK